MYIAIGEHLLQASQQSTTSSTCSEILAQSKLYYLAS